MLFLSLLAQALRRCKFIYQKVWGMDWLGGGEECGCSRCKRVDQNRPLGPFAILSSGIFSHWINQFFFIYMGQYQLAISHICVACVVFHSTLLNSPHLSH